MSSLMTEIEIANAISVNITDEDISIEGIIARHSSQESQNSLGKWLKERGKVL